jgi:phosphoribosylformylglycinamidine synthase II
MTEPGSTQGLSIYRFAVRPKPGKDARAVGLLQDAHALGLSGVSRIECQELYFVEGILSADEVQKVAQELLSDPITQIAEWGRPFSSSLVAANNIIEVALLPGVTDPVAEQIVRAAGVLNITGLLRASSGKRYEISGDTLDAGVLHLLARRLLANPVIQRYVLGEIEPVFPRAAEASGRVEIIPIRGLDTEQLLRISQDRRAALDVPEMQVIQEYFQSEGRNPTDVEFEMIAQTWSEHCVHKTFKAMITWDEAQQVDVKHPPINGLLKTYIQAATHEIAAPWVLSAFKDNAGIIDFEAGLEISFKVETHNHPSAIEPFGGANTGVGGVIRDVLGVSAKPIAATDVLCFGPLDLPIHTLPEGVLHPRRIQSGVVAGVQDYGNKIGIPTVSGAILYDPGYIANPLVFCGCVGIAPKGSHPSCPAPGDRVIVIGGRTGRDGLRGATFSSMTMDAQTGQVAGASVQIGDPITEKGLIEVVLRARDQKLYHAITDCGAGGLSSAVGEMSSTCGADIELKDVRLKYPGLAPWEIWLSEAQERMVLAVPLDSVPALQTICSLFEVALTDIGEFTASGRLVVRYAGQVVLDLDNHFLHHGIPQRKLLARLPVLPENNRQELPTLVNESYNHALLEELSAPDTASKENMIRIYDHEIQGGTVIKPLVGVHGDAPSDAVVLKPVGSCQQHGIVLSAGINPQYGKVDGYRMAVSVIDEAVRNAVAVGADPERIALLDNFCWGDPMRPETLGSLVEAARGCHDAARHYNTPFISGKDSLNNEYLGADNQRHAIPPTLLISAIGVIQDISKVVTMDLKQAGAPFYLLGKLDLDPPRVPGLPAYAPALYRVLHQAIQLGFVNASHDLSEGGLAVAAAEMCIGGRLGLTLQMDIDPISAVLFGEVNGCLLVEVTAESTVDFEGLLKGLPWQKIGVVSPDPHFKVFHHHKPVISIPLPALLDAWKGEGLLRKKP